MKNLIIILLLFPIISFGQEHRKHVLGAVFDTYPPIYSCHYCNKEFSPQGFLPRVYYNYYKNDPIKGYARFIDSLKKLNINDDSFFVAKWNEYDTTCISTEIRRNKSTDIYNNFIATHKPGRYYVSPTEWSLMPENMMRNGPMMFYGRFNDSILLADKWFKVIYTKKRVK